jgi:hypothetical protein
MRGNPNIFPAIAGGVGILLAIGSSAQAVLTTNAIGFDPDGAGNALAVTVDTFDFRPGNALSLGGSTAYQNFVNSNGAVQTPFDLLLQTSLKDMRLGNGPLFVLPAGSEITMVLRARQQISSVVPGTTTTITTGPVAGSSTFLELYYDGTPNVDDLAGTGFNDGILILSASMANASSSLFSTPGGGALDQHQANDYPPLTGGPTISGNGAFTSNINYANPDFFLTPPAAATFTTLLSTPFLLVDPSAAFQFTPGGSANGQLADVNGPTTAGAGLGAPSLGTNGPDLQFQSTSELTFTTIPEPATAGLSALGVLGLLGWCLHRRRHAAAGTPLAFFLDCGGDAALARGDPA